MVAPFVIQDSIIEGKGVFASQTIARRELITIFRGKIVSIPILQKMYKQQQQRIDDPFQISPRHYLLLKKPFIYFNHSCEPNSGFEGTGRLVAIKNINKGQEITFDYSATEWSDDKAWGIDWMQKWQIPCHCGAKKCRKVIRQFPFLSEKIKQQYNKLGILRKDIVTKWNKSNSTVK